MALVVKDRVRETSTTTGTGTITLAGAVTGYQSFSAIGNANTTYYTIYLQGGNEWEVGIGTYTASGTTLSRDTILASSNGGSAVNFSAGTKDVFVTYPAGRSVYYDTATNVTLNQLSATTVDTTNLEVTNIKAKDGTAAMSIADSTGVVSITANPVLSGGTANGVLYLNGSKVATSGSGFAYNGSTQVSLVSAGNAVHYLQAAGGSAARIDLTQAGYSSWTIYNGPADALSFARDGSERMRLNSTSLNIGGNFTSTNNTLQVTGNAAIGYTTAAPTTGLIVAGNVGVGTDSPRDALEVVGSGAAGILVSRSGVSSQYVTISSGSTGPTINASTGINSLSMGVNGAFFMLINSSGNVGIGTTNPAAKLDVQGSQNGISNPANGTINVVDTAAAALGVGGQIVFRGNYVTTTSTQYAAITAYKESATVDGSQYGASLIFNTRTQGGNNTEKMRLDSSGNLGVGFAPGATGSTRVSSVASSSSAYSTSGAYPGVADATIVGYGASNTSNTTGSFATYQGAVRSTAADIQVGGMSFVSASSGYAPNITFWQRSGASTYAEIARFDTSGNLGIGTSSPQSKLHILGNNSTANVQLSGNYSAGENNNNIGLKIQVAGFGSSGAWPTFGFAPDYGNGNFNLLFETVGNTYQFTSSATKILSATQSGNVGVGTTSPGQKLTVNGDVSILGGKKLYLWNSTNTHTPAITSPSADVLAFLNNAGTQNMTLLANGNLGIGETNPGARVHSSVSSSGATSETLRLDNPSDSANAGTKLTYRLSGWSYEGGFVSLTRDGSSGGTIMAFGTSANASTTNASAKMTLDASGNLIVGTTSTSYKLHVNGTGYFASTLTLGGGSRLSAEGTNSLNFNTNSGDRMILDSSGNLGLGVTPSAWVSGYSAMQIGPGATVNSTSDGRASITSNIFVGSGPQAKYIANGFGSAYTQLNGAHLWLTAPNNTSGANANASGISTIMTLDASGRLMVGTTTVRANITTDVDLVTQNGLGILSTSTTYGQGYQYIRFFNSAVAYAGSISQTASTGIGLYSGSDLILGSNSTERARITSGGELLVGTTTSANNLRVNQKLAIVTAGNDTYTGAAFTGYSGTTALAAPVLDFNRSRGTTDGSMTVVASGDKLAYIIGRGSDGTNFINAASITFEVDGTPGTNDMPGRIVFLTTADGASGSTERARITSGGYFKASNDGAYFGSTGSYHELRSTANDYVATIVNAHASDPYGIDIRFSSASPDNNNNYFLRCLDGTAVRCYIYSDGDLANHDGVYGTISDQKLKQDIVDAGSQWGDIKAIRFRKYRMKSDVAVNPDAPYLLGVVAQELEQVSPGLVDEHPDMETVEVTDEDGNVTQTQQPTGTTTKSVKSSILLMKAAVALQEAMARIEKLEAEVAALKGA